jgi:hypothetical protein
LEVVGVDEGLPGEGEVSVGRFGRFAGWGLGDAGLTTAFCGSTPMRALSNMVRRSASLVVLMRAKL